MKCTPLFIVCYLVFFPFPAFSGFDEDENNSRNQVVENSEERRQESPEAARDDAGSSSYARKYLTPAKEYLTREVRSLKGWMRDNLSSGGGYKTPRVVIDLPPVTEKQPDRQEAPTVERQVPVAEPEMLPEKELEKDPVPVAEAVVGDDEKEEKRAEEEPPAATPVEEENIESGPAQETAMPDVRTYPPGNPKPVPPRKEPEVVEKAGSPPPPAPTPKPVAPVNREAAPEPETEPAPSAQKETTEATPLPGGLTLGESLSLGVVHDGKEQNCIQKQRGYVLFCAQDVVWPDHIKKLFENSITLYRGAQAVVRYDGKELTHAHALFSSSGMKEVISYLESRYGPPLETFHRIVAPFEGRPIDNPTFIWRKNGTSAGKAKNITLEVRKFDDSRGGFPDMENGVVRLYGAGSLPIFPRVSPTEMMLVKFAVN